MDDRQLVDWPRRHEAPAIRARLREIRPIAELLYTWDGTWMLGEVRPNREREKAAIALMEEWKGRVAGLSQDERDENEHRAYWRDAWLGLQGFVWIRDYKGDPDGRIVREYERMCWKEDRGLLAADWDAAALASDSDERLRKRQQHMRQYIRDSASDIHRFAFRKPVSVMMGQTPQRRQAHG